MSRPAFILAQYTGPVTKTRLKRAGYREAIYWIAANDDTEWLNDEEPIISVTAALVQDLFSVERNRLIADLRRAVRKVRGPSTTAH